MRWELVAKPPGFEERAEQAGAAWAAANPNAKRPKDYWSAFRPVLADGFRQLCAYSAMYEPVGTVDHFVSWNEDRARAYEWSNYRFASGWLNSSKQSVLSAEIIDPFTVEDGWFEILLPSLQLVPSPSVPEHQRARVTFVLERLHLGHDERVVRQRREWYRMYQDGELTLDGLAKKAPLNRCGSEKTAGSDLMAACFGMAALLPGASASFSKVGSGRRVSCASADRCRWTRPSSTCWTRPWPQ
jgi:hypothetical protein